MTARNPVALTLACAVFLTLFTVWYQVKLMGLEWYEQVQWERTLRVMNGESGTPWQYRLFTESCVYATVRVFEFIGLPQPIGLGFLCIRLAQNIAAFSLATWYYRRLGLTLEQALLGAAFVAWGMCHGLYDGDFTFNTYTDISLFLCAGLLILARRPRWLLLLMLIAPFNRETSGCIPFMLLFAEMARRGSWRVDRETWMLFAATLAMWIAIVGGLRLVYGLLPYIVPTAGVKPILPLLTFNLTWWRTWVFLFATLGLLPLMAVASWKAWPPALRGFFFAIAPVWFPLHFSLAHAPETRLFFVPQVLLFVPAALLGLRHYGVKVAGLPMTRPANDSRVGQSESS
jgi:hypothetical protein